MAVPFLYKHDWMTNIPYAQEVGKHFLTIIQPTFKTVTELIAKQA